MASCSATAICDELFERLAGNEDLVDDAVVMVMSIQIAEDEYHEVFPASPEELRNMRSSIRSWVSDRGIPEQIEEDLLIAVGEATSNAVRRRRSGEASRRDRSVLLRSLDGSPQSDRGQGAVSVIIDATDVTFMDSTGLHALVEGKRMLHEKGSRIYLVPSQQVRRVLELVFPDPLFPMRLDTVAEALLAIDEADTPEPTTAGPTQVLGY